MTIAHPGNSIEIAVLFRVLAILPPIYPPRLDAVKSASALLPSPA
jgi:hypothetical protein